ncbi:MAG: hypothetical protein ACRDY7_04495 [Acidimicrobiia bacterium]
MGKVDVAPEVFSMVDFHGPAIAEVVGEVADLIGLPDDVDVRVEIDEASPFGRSEIAVDGRQVRITAEGGAIEDPHRLRQFSPPDSRLVFGRLLLKAKDRLDPAFGAAPPDRELELAQHVAWDTYAVGRYAALAGVDGGQARRRYAFRLRVGFTDTADRAFDRLWTASGLTWADLQAALAEARMP